ncbi:dethiobiotin synthase [Bhargavaea beijingensis]|uniref:ATP-dependent dethiobiotin synthetase BioD n=1 Tax=Bhargavaea beijingensis TaxID=426756 RepID=A0ABX9Z9M1_9BACL|nr:dethiobiotin synthase [Bhargavaea beijingensis]RSK24675.1 dethiobiotin synthase [Bhargavaea beijingensis]
MALGFWVIGTDTNVGKTFVTTWLMRYFQSKGTAIPYKPVQTGMIDDGTPYYGDTYFYRQFSQTELDGRQVNTYSFPTPASPHYAARLEGQTIEGERILRQIKRLTSRYDHVICEGAGGLYVPLDEKRGYCFQHLVKDSKLPVVLVTRTSLGTINHTLLTVEALRACGIPIIGIVFNGFEGTELEKDNRATICRLTGLHSVTLPKLSEARELEKLDPGLADPLFGEMSVL